MDREVGPVRMRDSAMESEERAVRKKDSMWRGREVGAVRMRDSVW